MENNWFEETKGGISFTKTEDYLFALGTAAEKRIGDMTRNELIAVIAAGYYERELLARTVLHLIGSQPLGNASDLGDADRISRLIIEKSEAVN